MKLHDVTAFSQRLRTRIAGHFHLPSSVEHGSLLSYLMTVLLMGLALWIRLAIAPVSAGLQYVTFFPAVTLAAIVGGYRTGLLATTFGLAFATYIFTPPYYSFSVAVLRTSMWSNLVFLADRIIMSFAIEAMHRYRQRYAKELEQSRDAHALLQKSTQYLKTILDNLFSYVALLDPNGVVQEVNNAPLDRGGYARQDVIGKNFFDAPWWSYDQNVRSQLIAAIEAANQGQTRRYDVVVKMGADLVPIDFQIAPVRDSDGRVVGLLPMAVDISERKRIETEVRKSRAALEQFKFTLDHTQDGVFIFHPTTLRFSYVNNGAKRQVGYGQDELMQMTPLDIKPNFNEQQFRTILKQLLDGSLKSYSFEAVHRHKDGHDIPVEIVLQFVQRVDLEPRFVAFSRDISERKRMDSELRIAAIAFESQENIMVTDANQVILRVNKAFTNDTGFSAEEAIGRTPRILKSGRHDNAFYAAMWESINRTGSWEGEIWNRHEDGGVFLKWLTITAIKSDDGIVTHYIGTKIDITTRKQVEEEFRNLAFYDPLTLLANRRLLLERLQHALASSVRSECYGGLLFIDLDNFKLLNDTLGHDKGDLLLQQVAERLTACIREGDTASRLGGDEFVVMLENLSDNFEESTIMVKTVGEKILATINQPFFLAGHEHSSSPSIGITLYKGHHHSSEELLKQADLAMYRAKKAGRNTYRFFDPVIDSPNVQ